jgi:hypothetical protein
MSEDVRRAATEAAMKAMGCEPWTNYTGWGMGPMQRCRIHEAAWSTAGCPVASSVADAVLAAVTGPLQAAAELDLLAQITERFDLGCWAGGDDVRREFHKRRANRLTAGDA